MSIQHFDLAIIGSGSGNSIPDERYDATSIAMFEESIYGGTCLNVGCIPTKMFVYAADVADAARSSERFGVHASVDSVDWPAIVERVFGRIDPISAGGREYRTDRCDNITVYSSHVRFDGVDDASGYYRLITDAGDQVLARQVVIAAGSRAQVPDVIAASGVRYYTNDDVMRLPDLPKTMTILGSGYIATEFAHVFAALGTEVTVVARSGRLLRGLDAELSERFTAVAATQWNVLLDQTVSGANQLEDGGVRLSFADGTHIDSEVLLVATGRTPNGDKLGLASLNIDLLDDGRVPVDAHGRTPAPNVWALGDVSSPFQLKHVANHEQRVVTENLLKGWHADNLDRFNHRYVPFAVFTHPQIAAVGLTEEEARKGHDVAVKVQNYGDVAYGWAMEDTTGFCKLVADRATGKLLGAHIMGPQASTVIQPVIQALNFGLTVSDMARGQYWIHPAMPEVLENALLGLELD
ncbi:mycothione reductase [Gordonia sp. (in: high G+C Gram-positive bacteria)]|uniref:mycothione reductase n=1 Tax=Gordonia sp. (in: high G+C Gram-positive bacteria) TaxID=84139 RepID=UPI003C734B3A